MSLCRVGLACVLMIGSGQVAIAQAPIRNPVESANEAHLLPYKSFDETHDRFGYTLHTLIVPADAVKSTNGDVQVIRIRYKTAALFDFGSSNLTSDAKSIVRDVARAIKSDASVPQIAIVGHTDNVGGEMPNRELSMSRAQSVAALLTQFGVPSSQIWIAGMGKVKPIASNDSEQGRALNRRVEFFVSNVPAAIEHGIRGSCTSNEPADKSNCTQQSGDKFSVHSVTKVGTMGPKVSEHDVMPEVPVAEILVRQHIPAGSIERPHIR